MTVSYLFVHFRVVITIAAWYVRQTRSSSLFILIRNQKRPFEFRIESLKLSKLVIGVMKSVVHYCFFILLIWKGKWVPLSILFNYICLSRSSRLHALRCFSMQDVVKFWKCEAVIFIKHLSAFFSGNAPVFQVSSSGEVHHINKPFRWWIFARNRFLATVRDRFAQFRLKASNNYWSLSNVSVVYHVWILSRVSSSGNVIISIVRRLLLFKPVFIYCCLISRH